MTLSHKLFSYAGIRKASISAHPAVVRLPTKVFFARHSTTSSKVEHDKFPFVCEVVANGPDFPYHEKLWNLGTISGILANFLLRMCKSDHKTISDQIFNPKFYTPIGCFLFDYEFCWHLLQNLCVF